MTYIYERYRQKDYAVRLVPFSFRNLQLKQIFGIFYKPIKDEKLYICFNISLGKWIPCIISRIFKSMIIELTAIDFINYMSLEHNLEIIKSHTHSLCGITYMSYDGK